MKRLAIILIIIFGLTGPKLSYAESETYRVAGDSQFPPYEYVDSNGTFKGFNVDLLKAIGLVTGIEFEFIPLTWDQAYNSISQGQADIIQGMKESDERKNKFLFSNSLLMNSQSIFVKDDNTDIKSLKDLSGKVVALNVEEILYDEIKEIPDVRIIEYRSFDEALQNLLDGRVDSLIGNTLTINYLCKEKDSIGDIKIVGDTLNEQKYSMAVGKDNRALLDKLNKGLLEIQKSGMYDSLYRKWFGTPIKNVKARYETIQRFLILTTIGLILLNIVIQTFNKRLKGIIEKKTEEQKALVNELRNYDKLQFMQKIISSLAHEIRNPMTSIRLYTTQIGDKLENKEFLLAASEDIPSEIDRIDRLIQEFMQYISPRKPLQLDLNLHEELENTIKLVKLQMKNVNINLDIDKAYFIKFDASQFKQVIINILLNSRDAIKDTENPTIYISARSYGDEIILSFMDNGHGMNEDEIQYIFEPFFTTKEFGNGVGMFVVKQIVDENGGRILAESAGEEKGMLIKLYVKKGDASEKQATDC